MDLLTSVAARSPPLRKEFYDSSHFPQPHLDDYAHISPRIHHNTSFTNLHTLHQQDDNNNNNNPFLRHSGSSSSLVGMGLYHGTRRVSIDEVPAHVTASPLHSTAAISSTSSSSATSPSPHLIHHSTLHSPASPYMLYPPSPLHPHHHIPPLHPITGQPPSPLHMRTQPPSPLHSRSASPSSAFRTPHSTDFEMLKKQYIPITTAAAAHLKMMTQAAAANGIGINNVTAPTPVTVPTPIATPAAAAAAPTTRRKASPSSMDPATQAAVNAEADSIMAAVEAESEAREQKKRGRGRTATKEKPVKEKKSAKGKKKQESEDSFEDGDAASISTSSTPKRRASPTPSAPNKRTKTHATDEERKKAKHREIDAHRRNREANALTTLQNLAFPDHPGRPEKAAVLIRSVQMLMDAQRDITSLRDKLDEMTRANEQLLAEKKIWEEQKMMYEIEREKGMVKKENKEEEIDIIPTKSRSVNNTALAELASYRDARSPLHHSLQRAFELGAASTMYQSMFVNASVIMCVMNTLGQCVDVNQRFVEKSGWARSDVIGRSLTSITAYSPLWTGSNDKVPRKMSSDELPVVKSPSSVSCMELPPYADTLKAILRLFKGKEQCVTCVHRMVDGWGRVVAVKANTWLVYEQGKIKYGICATTDENVTVVSESPSLALASPETSPSTSTSTPENQDSSNQTPTTTPTSSPAPATVTS